MRFDPLPMGGMNGAELRERIACVELRELSAWQAHEMAQPVAAMGAYAGAALRLTGAGAGAGASPKTARVLGQGLAQIERARTVMQRIRGGFPEATAEVVPVCETLLEVCDYLHIPKHCIELAARVPQHARIPRDEWQTTLFHLLRNAREANLSWSGLEVALRAGPELVVQISNSSEQTPMATARRACSPSAQLCTTKPADSSNAVVASGTPAASSTSNTRLPGWRTAKGMAVCGCEFACSPTSGTTTLKVDPRPSSERTSIRWPNKCAILFTTANPEPNPRARSRASLCSWVYSSKIASRAEPGMPMPVSATSMATSSWLSLRTPSVTDPASVYRTALPTKFSTMRDSKAGSLRTTAVLGCTSTRTGLASISTAAPVPIRCRSGADPVQDWVQEQLIELRLDCTGV